MKFPANSETLSQTVSGYSMTPVDMDLINYYILHMIDPSTIQHMQIQLPSDTQCLQEVAERHYARINRMSDSMKALVDPKLVQKAKEYGRC